MGWAEDFAELKRFYEEHGHSDVPANYPASPSLPALVTKLRLTQRNLANDKVLLLHSIDFRWNSKDPTWRDNLENLRQFVERSGKCDIPPGWEDDPQLAAWLETQRIAKRKGTLQYDRVQRLEALGVVWGADTIMSPGDIWDRRYEELKAYKTQHGTCNVPVKWKKNPALGSWVASQRQQIKRGKLPQDRVRLLAELQFEVGAIRIKPQADWETRFAELCEYKRLYGHCSVPREWDKNPQLSTWVTSQKQYIRLGKLREDRKKRLEEIGFLDPETGAGDLGQSDNWEENFRSLRSFRMAHGHCKVPIGWPENPELGTWVMSQRLRLSMLPAEQERRLRALGI